MSNLEIAAVILILIEFLLIIIGGFIWQSELVRVAQSVTLLGCICWFASLILFFFIADTPNNLINWIYSMVFTQTFNLEPLSLFTMWILLLIVPLFAAGFIAES